MNCLDFRNYWNDRLDAGQLSDVERLADALIHEKACADCHRIASGYRALTALLPLPSSPELPSPACADRVLERLASRRWTLSPKRLPLAIAAAAAVFLCVATGLLVRFNNPSSLETPVAGVQVHPSSRSLSLAFAEASKATWAFARDTSAPASRVGNDVFGVANPAEAAPRLSFSIPLDVTVKVDSSSEALRSLGRRVNDGVRPLSGTARTAFGFLLGGAQQAPPKINEPGSGA